MTIKSTRLVLAMVGALAFAAPFAAVTPADAAPNNMMMGGHDAMHDHNHRPSMRSEHRPPQPHGHYRWHAGAWDWHGGAWEWTPGVWIRF